MTNWGQMRPVAPGKEDPSSRPQMRELWNYWFFGLYSVTRPSEMSIRIQDLPRYRNTDPSQVKVLQTAKGSLGGSTRAPVPRLVFVATVEFNFTSAWTKFISAKYRCNPNCLRLLSQAPKRNLFIHQNEWVVRAEGLITRQKKKR
jgi:hypothetical protein